jgi:hypothetical protein
MSIVNPNSNKQHSRRIRPILRAEIEEAQRHTNSNAAAARWLQVNYITYRKYAKLYGLFDQHLNQDGVGIDKGFSKKPSNIPLREILNNQHPHYSPAKLKNRLIARKKLVEVCSLCGFNERRITDGRVPLMMNFLDGNPRNYNLTNLSLLCYNCTFLTTGAPSVIHKRYIKHSLAHPDTVAKQHIHPDITTSDHYDLSDESLELLQHLELSEEEKASALAQHEGQT